MPRARTLRRLSTPAERKLWRALRDRGLAGAKVRRQVPCGLYVLDFLFAAQRLIVEADGDTHATPGDADRDGRRDAWLVARGFRVLRFANRDILGNLEGVLLAIAEALQAPRPDPLPKGEGEDRELSLSGRALPEGRAA